MHEECECMEMYLLETIFPKGTLIDFNKKVLYIQHLKFEIYYKSQVIKSSACRSWLHKSH